MINKKEKKCKVDVNEKELNGISINDEKIKMNGKELVMDELTAGFFSFWLPIYVNNMEKENNKKQHKKRK